MGDLLRWSELGIAPKKPGLYAWYLRPKIAEAELASEELVLASIVEYAEYLKLPIMRLRAEGYMSLVLSGDLQHEVYGTDQRKEEKKKSTRVVMKTARSRALLAKILELSTPGLVAPLYIGVATSIKVRLSQHKKSIMRIQRDLNSEPDLSLDTERGYSFAKEIAKRNVPPSRLEVYVAPIEDAAFSVSEIRQFVEGAETILNRMYYPILGRR